MTKISPHHRLAALPSTAQTAPTDIAGHLAALGQRAVRLISRVKSLVRRFPGVHLGAGALVALMTCAGGPSQAQSGSISLPLPLIDCDIKILSSTYYVYIGGNTQYNSLRFATGYKYMQDWATSETLLDDSFIDYCGNSYSTYIDTSAYSHSVASSVSPSSAGKISEISQLTTSVNVNLGGGQGYTLSGEISNSYPSGRLSLNFTGLSAATSDLPSGSSIEGTIGPADTQYRFVATNHFQTVHPWANKFKKSYQPRIEESFDGAAFQRYKVNYLDAGTYELRVRVFPFQDDYKTLANTLNSYAVTGLPGYSEYTYTLVVKDETPPTLTLSSTTLNIPAETTSVDAETWLTGYGAAATDNSLTPIDTKFYINDVLLTSMSQLEYGPNTVTLVATDQSGNNSEPQAVTLNWLDSIPPDITAPGTYDLTTDSGAAIATFDLTTLDITVTDNLDTGLTVSFWIEDQEITGPYSFDLGETLITLKSTDSSGNTGEATITVVTSDGEPPVLTAPADQTLTTDMDQPTGALSLTGLGSVSDNADESVAITYWINDIKLGESHDFQVGNTTVTLNASDSSGNEAVSVAFTVTVNDQQAPDLSFATPIFNISPSTPEQETLNVNFGNLISASDNVTEAPTITYFLNEQEISSTHHFPVGQATEITVIATDAAGNATSPEIFTINVLDITPPVLTAPEDQVLATDPDKATAALDVAGLGSVSDNVDEGLTISYWIDDSELTASHDFPVGDTTVTLRAADSSDNEAEPVTFTVTVKDQQAPELSAISTALNVDPGDTLAQTSSVDFSHFFSATDNVTAAPTITYVFNSEEITLPHDFPVGRISKIYVTASDEADNTSETVVFWLLVNDITPPVLTPPTSHVLATDPDKSTAALSMTGLGSVSDNVDENVTISYWIDDAELGSSYDFPVGDTTVTLRASDSSGNEAASVTFTVTVNDLQAPNLSSNSTGLNVDPGNTAAQTTSIDFSHFFSATDNVTAALTITYVFNEEEITLPYDFPVGQISKIYVTASDEAGNTSAPFTFTLLVNDITKPILTPPQTQVLSTDPDKPTAALTLTGLGSVSDNVDEDLTISYWIDDTELGGSHDFPVGDTTVTLRASDSFGNAADTVTFFVTVNDQQAPELLNNGTGLNVDPDDPALETVSVDFSHFFSATDNVTAAPTITYVFNSEEITLPHDFPVGKISKIYVTAADGAGNSSETTVFWLLVNDITPPVITPPADQSLPNDPGLTTAAFDPTTLGSVSDNVDAGEDLDITYWIGAEEITGSHVFPLGQTTVTMKAQDAAGNKAATVSFTVTVTDTEAPVITPPEDQVLPTENGTTSATLDVTALALATDNVDSTVDVTYWVGGQQLSGPYVFPLGTTTVTLQAQDAAGNEAAAVSFTVTVRDTGSPVITPPDIQDLVTDPGLPTAALDVTALGSATDLVDGPVAITYTTEDMTLSGPYPFPVGETIVTMTAQDSSDNIAQDSFAVRVRDNQPPVITPPADQSRTTDPDAITSLFDVTALGSVTDLVDDMVEIFYRVEGIEIVSAYAFPIGDTTVTMDARDDAGNAATQVSFTVTVADGQAPVITPPDDQTLTTDPGQPTATLDVTTLGAKVTDLADDDSSLVILYHIGTLPLTGPHAFPIGETTVTLDATDATGNEAIQASFIVKVDDHEAPVITPPETLILEAETLTQVAHYDLTTLGSVADNADPDLSILYIIDGTPVKDDSYTFPLGDTTVTMAAIDNAGNPAVEQSFIVRVEDTTGPLTPVFDTPVVAPDLSVTVSGTTEAHARVAVTFADTSQQSLTADGLGVFSASSATPQRNGTVTATAYDSHDNASATASLMVTVDASVPTVQISGLPELANAGAFDITITFSEPVTGFEASDIAVSGATISNFSGTAPVFTAIVTPEDTPGIVVTLSIPAGVAEDPGGNLNLASDTYSLITATTDAAEAQIAEVLESRSQALVAHQPSLSGFLMGGGSRQFNASVSRRTGVFTLATDPDRPAWMRLEGSWQKDDDYSSRYIFGAFGTHRKLNDNLLLGAMVQIDEIAQDEGAAELNGHGVLAGPYFVGKLPDHPFYIEGRLLYGKSWNEITPDGTYTDSFTTERWLTQIKGTGQLVYPRYELRPFLAAGQVVETQQSYTDGNGLTVPEATYRATEVEYGLSMLHSRPTESGELTLEGGISGVYQDQNHGDSRASARLRFGLSHAFRNAGLLALDAAISGLGPDQLRTKSIGLTYSFQF